MRLIRYDGGDGARWGILDDDEVFALEGSPYRGPRRGPRVAALADVRLLAPAEPSKIICVGRNYKSHAEEFGNAVPDEPLLFLKPPSSMIGPGGVIHYPELSHRVDPEAELVLVIGREAHRVTAGDAFDVIAGYTCGNDVTARDIQKSDGQWTRGKGFDTFCPIGPWIETDLDPSDVGIRCTVNGELRQEGRTRDLIFPIPFLIEYISRFVRLLPGDLIMTGTPEGVAPMEVGSTVAVTIEGIGTLENRLEPEPALER
jgi:2-keto-4-pentenoate hydratase/2-oxohepta-3-ene-1,7-dioic acid hydratase in catechol pathway